MTVKVKCRNCGKDVCLSHMKCHHCQKWVPAEDQPLSEQKKGIAPAHDPRCGR